MNRVIIAGSRDIPYDYYNHVETYLLTFFRKRELHNTDVEIISGGARGSDKMGEKFAKKYNCKLTIFPADWGAYGKKAGYIRNKEMATYAKEENGILIAFWDGQSKGTKHMIDIAKDNGIDINIEFIVF